MSRPLKLDYFVGAFLSVIIIGNTSRILDLPDVPGTLYDPGSLLGFGLL